MSKNADTKYMVDAKIFGNTKEEIINNVLKMAEELHVNDNCLSDRQYEYDVSYLKNGLTYYVDSSKWRNGEDRA